VRLDRAERVAALAVLDEELLAQLLRRIRGLGAEPVRGTQGLGPPRVRYASRAALGPPEKATKITAKPASTKGTRTIRTSIEGGTIPAASDGERGR